MNATFWYMSEKLSKLHEQLQGSPTFKLSPGPLFPVGIATVQETRVRTKTARHRAISTSSVQRFCRLENGAKLGPAANVGVP